MAGPVLSVLLPGPLSQEVATRLDALMHRLARPGSLERQAAGNYAVGIEPERLGIADAGGAGARPFLVVAQEADDEPRPALGFEPTHAVSVIALSDDALDHRTAAMLALEVMAIAGGAAEVELYEDQVGQVRDLPGLLALDDADASFPLAFGTDVFVKAWLAHPRFKLAK